MVESTQNENWNLMTFIALPVYAYILTRLILIVLRDHTQLSVNEAPSAFFFPQKSGAAMAAAVAAIPMPLPGFVILLLLLDVLRMLLCT